MNFHLNRLLSFPLMVVIMDISWTTWPVGAYAEPEEVVVTARGVAGDMDSELRDPVLSVGRIATKDNVKLLVDAFVENKEYQAYPLKFEFYVNRKLIQTQIRSLEMPGPIGIDITPDLAMMPFNYTVSACMIHPNQNFCTVINGMAMGPDVLSNFNCTLTLVEGDESSSYSISDVVLEKQGDHVYALSFEAAAAEGDHKIKVSASLNIADNSASGPVTVESGDEIRRVETSGEAVSDSEKLLSFDVSDEKDGLVLKCERQ